MDAGNADIKPDKRDKHSNARRQHLIKSFLYTYMVSPTAISKRCSPCKRSAAPARGRVAARSRERRYSGSFGESSVDTAFPPVGAKQKRPVEWKIETKQIIEVKIIVYWLMIGVSARMVVSR